MALHCHECGFVNDEGANYCQKCGAYLGRSEGTEEPSTLTYKLVFGAFYISCFVFTSYINWKLNRERYNVFLNAGVPGGGAVSAVKVISVTP